jgi:L-ascorbate metabolism protein UlaG (beta-lactamase superfamily)
MFFGTAAAESETTVQYLANEGVMVTHEDTKVLFDPLFENTFDTYQKVPDDIRKSMLAGAKPYDGVDAVFISHFHGDHFSPTDVMTLMENHPEARLYAPAQAVAEMRRLAASELTIFDRVVGLDLEYGDRPVNIRYGALVIDAIHIPHSGWPTARTEVQNIAFRVTLEDTSTVLHLGDADPRLVHFSSNDEYWDERTVDLALPPYWFFASDDGNAILEDRLDVRNAIGIHVPASFSDSANIPPEIRGSDLFTRPGESRRFMGSQ